MKKIIFVLFVLMNLNGYGQQELTKAVNKFSDLTTQTIPPPKKDIFTDYSSQGSTDLLTGRFGLNVTFHEIQTPYFSLPITLSYSTSGVKIDDLSNEVGLDWNLFAGGSITRIVNDVEDDRGGIIDSYPLFMHGRGLNYSEDLLPSEYHNDDHLLFILRAAVGQQRGTGICKLSSYYVNNFPKRGYVADQSLSEIGCLIEKKKWTEYPVSDQFGGTPTVDLDTQLDYFMVNVGKLNFSFVIKRKDQFWGDLGDISFELDPDDYFEAVPLDNIGMKIKLYIDWIPYNNVDKYDQFPVERGEGNGSLGIKKFEITDKDGIMYTFDKWEYFDHDELKEFNHNFSTGVDGKRVVQYKYYETNVNSWKLTSITLPNRDQISFTYQSNNYLYSRKIPRMHEGEYQGFPYNLIPKMPAYGLNHLNNHFEGYSISEISYLNQRVKFFYSTQRPDFKTGGLNLNKIELSDARGNLIRKFDLIKEFTYADADGGHEDYRMYLKQIIDSQKSNSYTFSYLSNNLLPARGKIQYQDIFGYFMGNTANPNLYPAFPRVYISPNDINGNKISYEQPIASDYFVTNGSDRSVKPVFPGYGAMNKVVFPTGGSLRLDYESNTYYDSRLNAKISLGPGIRVKNLNYYTDDNTLKLRKSYTYNKFDNNQYSSGELLYKPSYAYISNWSFNNYSDKSAFEHRIYDLFSNEEMIQYWRDQNETNSHSKEMLLAQGFQPNDILKRMVHLSSYPLGPVQDIYGRELIYKNVTEKSEDVSGVSNNGYTRYYFKYADNRGLVNSITGPSDELSIYAKGTVNTDFYNFRPFYYTSANPIKTKSGYIERQGKEIYPFPQRNFFNTLDNAAFGKLEKKELYNSQNQLVYSENYTYDFIKKNSINNNILKNIQTGYLKMHTYLASDPSQVYYPCLTFDGTYYQSFKQNFIGLYFFVVNPLQFNSQLCLKTKNTKNYFDTYSFGDDITYDYSTQNGNLISETAIDSNGAEIKTSYGYPYSDSDYSWLNEMYARNIISKPYKVLEFKNNELIATTDNEYYVDENNIIRLKRIKTEKGNTLLGEPESRIEFKKYDDRGMVQEVSLTGGLNIVYIYGEGTLPIAKIENVKYEELNASLISAAKLAQTETDLLTALSALRNSIPSTAMITTYTYKLFIGMSTQTDPRGYMTFYSYDDQNRLISVKDKDGNILEEYKYHYKSEN